MAPLEKKKILKTWATIQKQKTKKGSSKIVFIGAMSADAVILAAAVVLSGDRQRGEKKKEKTQFIVFCKCYKTPNGSKKKQKKQKRWVQQPRTFGGPRSAFHMVWRKRCSPASDPNPPDWRPGEKVGRGFVLPRTTARPHVAQRSTQV